MTLPVLWDTEKGNKGTEQQCNTATLQYCNTAILQYCNTALLQYCNTAILQYCNTAVLQYCNTAVLQYCNTAILQYCIAFKQNIRVLCTVCIAYIMTGTMCIHIIHIIVLQPVKYRPRGIRERLYRSVPTSGIGYVFVARMS